MYTRFSRFVVFNRVLTFLQSFQSDFYKIKNERINISNNSIHEYTRYEYTNTHDFVLLFFRQVLVIMPPSRTQLRGDWVEVTFKQGMYVQSLTMYWGVT